MSVVPKPKLRLRHYPVSFISPSVIVPTTVPTIVPTTVPTIVPTIVPTVVPTVVPTPPAVKTLSPVLTTVPTVVPTVVPPPPIIKTFSSPPSSIIFAPPPKSVPTPKFVLPLNVPGLQPISAEQTLIVEAVRQGSNVCVDAVAGSGKTTTSLYIAYDQRPKSILLLTYNAKLKLETRQKVRQLHLEHMEVHSYHSFCVKYYDRTAHTDQGILNCLKKTRDGDSKHSYQLIIVDEAQDMNPLYYELICLLYEQGVRPQLVVMGDRKQSIYAFNRADSRFLTLSPQIFQTITGSRPWVKATLNTSYRLTHCMADFLNRCCRGAPPIQTVKSGPRVKYLICDAFGQQPMETLMRYLSGKRYSDVFILAPSVKTERSPVRRFANQLTNAKIPVYVPTSDEEKLDADILQGKIVFSTFHQVKGLERPIVMVFGFDQSYFDFYAKDTERDQIPNTLYVAITRAQQQLILVHHHTDHYVGFLDASHLREMCDVVITCRFKPKKNQRTSNPKELRVTELVKYVPVEVLDQCMSQFHLETLHQPQDPLSLPLKIQQEQLYEGVSEITGSAIPSYYEYRISGHMTIYEYLKGSTEDSVDESVVPKFGHCLLDTTETPEDDERITDDRLFRQISPTQIDEPTCQSLLQLTTRWVCQGSGYDFKKSQIKQYTWLTPSTLDRAIQRLDQIFPPITHPNLQFEKRLEVSFCHQKIIGFADIYNRHTCELWELKVVTEINGTHFLQVLIYAWMINQMNTSRPISQVYVYNLLDNSCYLIHFQPDQLSNMIRYLIEYKQMGEIKQSNDEFILMCQTIADRYQQRQS